MTFAREWALLLLTAPLLWTFWEWRLTRRHAALLLKAAASAAIILALAEPRLRVFETKVAVAALIDSSGSIPQEQIEQQRKMAASMEAARGRDALRLISFDESTQGLRSSSSEPATRSAGTNLEAAISNALAALPAGRVPRIALISDGWETQGAVERALWKAQTLGVPIDTIPLEGRPEPELRFASVEVPARAFVGENIPIELSIVSPRAAAATVQLTVGGKTIGRSDLNLQTGGNRVHVRARIKVAGATLLTGRVDAPELGEIRFDRSIALDRPRALLISTDPAESDRHLLQVLAAAEFHVDRHERSLPPSLSSYHVVIANNQDLEAWAQKEKERLEEFVQEGGGFVLIAGEKNLYLEPPENYDGPLARMLPAELAPPRTPEGTSVVLVLDKSSSMEGKKMQLARQSAIGVVNNLRRIDRVGVLVFDNSFQWAVPLRPNREPEVIKQLISGIIADGGTQIAPALHEAYRGIRETESVYKHILLLTDGISEEGDSITLARESARQKITISTVGLGQDVNRAYLERVAETAEGRSYFLIDVLGLEQIVLRDVMEHTGSSIMEASVVPEQLSEVEIFDGVSIEDSGPLLGWVKFRSKPRAETLLTVGQEGEKDPLLVRWQYGLGRSAVFASDAKARWAANWLGWPGFDRLWTNLLRDLLPRSPATEATTRYDGAKDEIVVSYRLSGRQGLEPPDPLPDLFVLGPSDFRQAVPLRRVAEREYESRFPIGGRVGLFRIRAESALGQFPEIAHYRANNELERYGANTALLQGIASQTGGRFNPEPAQVFDAGGRSVRTSMDLWPGLLVLATLLNLLELLGRKGWLPWLRRWA